MRLLRLCLLILALRLFLSDPIMCYDFVCCFSCGENFRCQHLWVFDMTGTYVTIF